MDKIIEKFLQLTQYTYIHGEEYQLEKFLPDNLQKDEVGNYFIEIGESETMFCSHLDTAAFEKEKVTHDFFKNDKGHLFVGTTGETVKYSYIDFFSLKFSSLFFILDEIKLRVINSSGT